MKYIILERKLAQGIKQTIPVIFPKDLVHADVADAIMQAINQPGQPVYPITAVSAGDITLGHGVLHCSGSSSTLGLDSRPQDASIIEMIDYLSIG